MKFRISILLMLLQSSNLCFSQMNTFNKSIEISKNSLVYKDSNTSLKFSKNNLVEYHNYDSTVSYNESKSEFKIFLYLHRDSPRATPIIFSFKDSDPIIYYENKRLKLDSLNKTVDSSGVNGMLLVTVELYKSFFTVYYIDKQLSSIFFPMYRGGVGFLFREGIASKRICWSFFESSFFLENPTEFVVNTDNNGVPDVIHYFNYSNSFGLYTVASKNKKKKYEKIYQFDKTFYGENKTYIDSRVIANISGKSLKPNKFDVLYWQYIIPDIFKRCNHNQKD